MKLTIEITEADLNKGLAYHRSRPRVSNCPIANALTRITGRHWMVWVDHANHLILRPIHSSCPTFLNAPDAVAFIRDFDAERGVGFGQRFTFELPDEQFSYDQGASQDPG